MTGFGIDWRYPVDSNPPGLNSMRLGGHWPILPSNTKPSTEGAQDSLSHRELLSVFGASERVQLFLDLFGDLPLPQVREILAVVRKAANDASEKK